MFVERDTGAKHYFEVPLAQALNIYNDAASCISGIGRTVRGPSMSTTPGKVHVIASPPSVARKCLSSSSYRAGIPLDRDAVLCEIRRESVVARRLETGVRREEILLRGRARVDC